MFQAIFTYLYNIYIYFMVMLNAAKETSFQITSSSKSNFRTYWTLENFLITDSRMTSSIIRLCIRFIYPLHFIGVILTEILF